MASQYFFDETRNAVQDLTESFGFLWPTAAAIWNLRISLMEYLRLRPEASAEELHRIFVRESGIHSADLRSFFVEQDWLSLKQRLARTLLLDTFAVYESWVREIIIKLASKPKGKLEKAMQKPTEHKAGSASTGIRWAINELLDGGSDFLRNNVHPGLTKNKKYGLEALDRQLAMYRYFKEARNCAMHRGGLADERLVSEQQKVVSLTVTELGLNGRKRRGKDVGEVPQIIPVVLGQRVELDLRGVIGLSDLIIRVMTTVDAELSCARASEQIFCQKWQASVNPWINFSSKKEHRKKACRGIANAMKLKPFQDAESVVAFARAHRIAG